LIQRISHNGTYLHYNNHVLDWFFYSTVVFIFYFILLQFDNNNIKYIIILFVHHITKYIIAYSTGRGEEDFSTPVQRPFHKNTLIMITAPVKWSRPRPIFLSQQIRRIILSLYYCNRRSKQGIHSHTNHKIVSPHHYHKLKLRIKITNKRQNLAAPAANAVQKFYSLVDDKCFDFFFCTNNGTALAVLARCSWYPNTSYYYILLFRRGDDGCIM